MKRSTLLLFLLLATFSVKAVDIAFHEALQKHMIEISVKGRGGYNGKSLEMQIQNRTSLNLELKILPGTVFQSQDEDLQNLMVTAEEVLTLQPKSKAMLALSTMCIQSHNMSPYAGALFAFSEIASGDLKKLVELIAEKGYSGSSTAQSAVWALTDGASIREVYGSDTSMVRLLAKQVSQALNVDISNFDFTPRRHQILSLSGSVECLVKDYAQSTALRAYRKDNGEMLREIFQNYPVKPGFYQFRFGIHHSLGDSIPFMLKLETPSGKVLYEKEIGYNESIPEMRKMNQEQFITFDLDRPVKGRVGIYDGEDNLYILMYDQKSMQQGFHKVHFIEGRDLPADKQYYIKVKDLQGNTIVSNPFASMDAPTEKFRPRVERGRFNFTLKESITNARLDIYDAYGRKVWVVFEDSRLRAGEKQIPYAFQHRQGPNATFTWKLVDGNGEVLEEHPVK